MLSFDELAGTLRTTKDRVLQGVARSPGGGSLPPNSNETGKSSSGEKAPQTTENQPEAIEESSTTAANSESDQGSSDPASRRQTPTTIRQEAVAPSTSGQESILSPIRRIDLAKGAHEDENTS